MSALSVLTHTIAACVGGTVGILAMALLVAGGDDDPED